MKNLFLYSCLILIFSNCNNNDDNDVTDCNGIACTNEFRTLFVSIRDENGAVVLLDSFEVLDKETSKDITLEINDTRSGQNNQYPLYSDLFVSGNENTTRTLVFNGFINDELLVEAEFIVDTDCCHVSLTRGNTEITIN